MTREDVGHSEAWTVNMKLPYDMVVAGWSEATKAYQQLQEKVNTLFFSTQQHLDEIKLEAARSAQVNNAVINAALTKSVLGGPLEESIEGKLAAQFPASVTEMVTAFTDKLTGMVGQEAMVGIVEAIIAGKVYEEGD